MFELNQKNKTFEMTKTKITRDIFIDTLMNTDLNKVIDIFCLSICI